jgi:hypothetical protein
LLLRNGAARTTGPVTGGGDGGLDTRGNGGLVLGIGAGTAVALIDAFDADGG